jgi:hypothetical protein
MSVNAKRNIALATLAVVGGLVAGNSYLSPSKHDGIKVSMKQQLEEYNSTIHPEQDRMQVLPHPWKIHVINIWL